MLRRQQETLIMADVEGILSKEEMEEIGLEPDQVKVVKYYSGQFTEIFSASRC